jgi:hypothetical protein
VRGDEKRVASAFGTHLEGQGWSVFDGYQIGMFVSYTACGDAWVKAPGGWVAGLVWETAPEAYFTTLIEPDDHRWGTYAVALNLPLTSDAEAEAYLLA